MFLLLIQRHKFRYMLASLMLIFCLIILSTAQWQTYKLRNYLLNAQSSMVTLHQSTSIFVPPDINYTIPYSHSYNQSTTALSDIFVIFGLTQYKMNSHFFTQQFEMSLLIKKHTQFTVNVKTVTITQLFKLGISYLVIASNGKNDIGTQYFSYESAHLTPLNQSVSIATIRQKQIFENITGRISGKLVKKNFKVGIILMGFYQRTDNGLNITLKAQIYNDTTVLIRIGVGYQTRLLKITCSVYLKSEDPSLTTDPVQNLMLIQAYNVAFTSTQILHTISRNINGQTIDSINFFIGISSFYFAREDTKLDLEIALSSPVQIQVRYNGQTLDRMDCLIAYVGQKFCASGTWYNYSLQWCSITNACPDGYVTYFDSNYSANFCYQCDELSNKYWFNYTSRQCVFIQRPQPTQLTQESSTGIVVAAIAIPLLLIVIIGSSICIYCYKRRMKLRKVINRSQVDLKSLHAMPDINM